MIEAQQTDWFPPRRLVRQAFVPSTVAGLVGPPALTRPVGHALAVQLANRLRAVCFVDLHRPARTRPADFERRALGLAILIQLVPRELAPSVSDVAGWQEVCAGRHALVVDGPSVAGTACAVLETLQNVARETAIPVLVLLDPNTRERALALTDRVIPAQLSTDPARWPVLAMRDEGQQHP